MASRTERTCDFCHYVSVDDYPDEGNPVRYLSSHSIMKDVCKACFARGLYVMTAKEIDSDVGLDLMRRAQAAEGALATAEKMIAELRTANRCEQDHGSVAKDAIARLERDLSDARDHAEFLQRDFNTAVALMGKKRRERYATKISSMIAAYRVKDSPSIQTGRVSYTGTRSLPPRAMQPHDGYVFQTTAESAEEIAITAAWCKENV